MVVDTEKKRKMKPSESFRGRVRRKSSISREDVRTERKITTEVKELARPATSMIVKKE